MVPGVYDTFTLIVLAVLIAAMSWMAVQIFLVIVVELCHRSRYRWCKRGLARYYAIIGWLKGSMPVALIDYQGQIYFTLASKVEDSDKFTCYIYDTTKIGLMILNEDGTVSDPRHFASYVKNWLYLDDEKRIHMILCGARGFEIYPQ